MQTVIADEPAAPNSNAKIDSQKEARQKEQEKNKYVIN